MMPADIKPPAKRPAVAKNGDRRMNLIALWLVTAAGLWFLATVARLYAGRGAARGIALDLALAFGVAATISTLIVLGYALFRRPAKN